jgi:hypothetical protein
MQCSLHASCNTNAFLVTRNAHDSTCRFRSHCLNTLTLTVSEKVDSISLYSVHDCVLHHSLLMLCWPCIIVQYISTVEPASIHFLFSWLRINSITPELNPSAQRCLTRILLGILLFGPCISLIYAWKTNKRNNYSFNLLIIYGKSYMFRHYIAIFKELS